MSIRIWLVIDESFEGHIMGVYTDENLARERVESGWKEMFLNRANDILGWALVSYVCLPEQPHTLIVENKEKF